MIEFRLRAFAETTSTNDEVKRALEAGEPEGLAVRARRQVAGYGRQGRTWTSPDGGLYCSLLLRPQVAPRELPTLSLVTGMAVRRALVGLADDGAADRIRIKWPNDVVVVQEGEATLQDGSKAVQSSKFTCELAEEGGVDAPVAQNAAGRGEFRGLVAENACYVRFSHVPKKGDRGFCYSNVHCERENRAQRACSATDDMDAVGAADTEGVAKAIDIVDVAKATSVNDATDATDVVDAIRSADCDPCSAQKSTSAPAKLCGISLEVHAGGVCVGIGVNVLPLDGRADVGGKNAPAYLVDLVPRLADYAVDDALGLVHEAVLDAFAPLYEAWGRTGFEPLVDEFNEHASLTGSQVSVVDQGGNALASGKVMRVDGFGRLILRDALGLETPVSSGEAHIL